MSDTFAAFVEGARARVDEALERHLPQSPDNTRVLTEAIRYSLFAGGKRLRPIVALAAADAVARQNRSSSEAAMERALPLACALECIHTYSLIHDDLPAMDNDSLRRGRPTLHMVYGDGMAILAADGLQAEAFALMGRLPVPVDLDSAARQLKALSLVATCAGVRGMVGGQAVDLQAAGQVKDRPLTLDAEQLRGMHMMKTAALIRASAVGGALMAGASAPAERAISSWGLGIGHAFQIVDDILDVEGSDSTLGKTAGKDAAHDKPTYVSLWGLDRSRAMAEECRSHAHKAISDAGLTEGWLDALADWVITRKN